MSTRTLRNTPMLDQLEIGPWPSFVTGLKRLARDNDTMVDLIGAWGGDADASLRTRAGGTFHRLPRIE